MGKRTQRNTVEVRLVGEAVVPVEEDAASHRSHANGRMQGGVVGEVVKVFGECVDPLDDLMDQGLAAMRELTRCEQKWLGVEYISMRMKEIGVVGQDPPRGEHEAVRSCPTRCRPS